jgi:hypothetical protein
LFPELETSKSFVPNELIAKVIQPLLLEQTRQFLACPVPREVRSIKTDDGYRSITQYLDSNSSAAIWVGEDEESWAKAIDRKIADQMWHEINERKAARQANTPVLVGNDEGSHYLKELRRLSGMLLDRIAVENINEERLKNNKSF